MSRWHTTTVNFQSPSSEYRLEIIRHPDEEGQDCIAGEPARLRVYYYAPTGTLQSEATGGTRATGPAMLEPRSEVVTFQWGWGDVEKWDRWGRTRVYFSPLRRAESRAKSHQYSIPFRDITVSRATTGDVVLRAFFGASATPEIEGEITLNFLDPADPEAEPPTGETPMIQAVRTDSGPIHPGVSHGVRVYHWHPDGTTLSRWEMSGVSVSAGSTGTESITETVEFRNGVGQISVFDTNGRRERVREDLAGEWIAYADVTYSAPYQDFSISGAAADKPYAVAWYWDGEGEALYQFQATVPQPGDFPDQSSCEAAGYHWYNGACHSDPAPVDPGGLTDQSSCEAAGNYWYDGACHSDPAVLVSRTIQAYNHETDGVESGANVFIDGQLKGQTSGLGNITVTGLIQGRTYQLKITKPGFLDSDADTLANDSFVA